MNDCCASSSPANKAATSKSAALSSYAVRPGVTFPDWSVVKSADVKEALLAMVGSDHVLTRWSGYDPGTDRVRIALLQLYAEEGRAPAIRALAERAGLSEMAIRPLLEELRRRDLVVLDGERIVTQVAKFKSPLCLPHGVPTNHLSALVNEWLEAHPERLHQQAANLVLTAVKENFPCAK